MELQGSNYDFVKGEMLLIDKPLEWTSFDVVNLMRFFLRKVYNLKKLKVGHAGTLDPLATGLLIICTGRKTKEIAQYQGMNKTYVGSMFIGATTPSYDRETEIDNNFEIGHLTEKQLQEARKQFIGEIDQLPPAFSAIKVKGKRAYDLARKNSEVKLNSRKVIVHDFSLLNIDLPQVDFSVNCSKGTYIRSLVYDFGKSIDNGAYLSELRRTRIGNYKVSDALTLEEFKKKVLEEVNRK